MGVYSPSYPTVYQYWIENLNSAKITGKKTRSTVLNPRRAKEFAYRVLLHGTSCVHARCTRYFFQRDTSSKVIAIAIVEDDPLVEIG